MGCPGSREPLCHQRAPRINEPFRTGRTPLKPAQNLQFPQKLVLLPRKHFVISKKRLESHQFLCLALFREGKTKFGMIFIEILRDSYQNALTKAVSGFIYKIKEEEEEHQEEAEESKEQVPNGNETSQSKATSTQMGQKEKGKEGKEQPKQRVFVLSLRKAFVQPKQGENDSLKLKKGSNVPPYKESKIFQSFLEERQLREEEKNRPVSITGLERIPGQSCSPSFITKFSKLLDDSVWGKQGLGKRTREASLNSQRKPSWFWTWRNP